MWEGPPLVGSTVPELKKLFRELQVPHIYDRQAFPDLAHGAEQNPLAELVEGEHTGFTIVPDLGVQLLLLPVGHFSHAWLLRGL